jgi:hypothetical protein
VGKDLTMDASKKTNHVSFKDVQIQFLMDGVNGVEGLYERGLASKATVRRALRELKSSGRDTSHLERWVVERFGSTGRGRAAPIIGETRTYKAQQINTGGPFLRLPLDVLGIEKGSTVRVTFGDNAITVSK